MQAYLCDIPFSNILQLTLDNLLALFRDSEVVLLRYFATCMSHLVAEKVGGGVLLSEAGAVGMAEIVVFEVYAKSFFDFLRVVFH